MDQKEKEFERIYNSFKGNEVVQVALMRAKQIGQDLAKDFKDNPASIQQRT